MRSGRLIAVEPTECMSGTNPMWKCKCDCGNFKNVSSKYIINKRIKSCGCLRNESASSRRGPLSPRWKPWLTDEDRQQTRKFPKYHEWRTAVFKRDNFTCQKCGDNTGGNLNAHHIESYTDNKELRTELSNGATLCEDCHKDFHRTYGNHSTRKQFEEWI